MLGCGSGVREPGSGFQVSGPDFRVRVSGFGFRGLHLGPDAREVLDQQDRQDRHLRAGFEF